MALFSMFCHMESLGRQLEFLATPVQDEGGVNEGIKVRDINVVEATLTRLSPATFMLTYKIVAKTEEGYFEKERIRRLYLNSFKNRSFYVPDTNVELTGLDSRYDVETKRTTYVSVYELEVFSSTTKFIADLKPVEENCVNQI